jgi:glycosyltransferase involved in cell wall biosynthesis
MDSALAQTFGSIEFLICDDCGTDSSMDIIREYQQTHLRGKDIRVVRQPQNEGLGSARNRIMDEAQGNYLFFMDGDDAIAPQTIQLLYDKAKEQNAEMVYGSYKRVFVKDGVVVDTQDYPYPYKSFCEPDEYACYAYDRNIQTMTWNFLIKVDILRNNHLRVAPIGFGEDFTFTVDLPTYVTRVVLLPDITYSYYIRDSNIHRWNKNITREMLDAYIKTIDEKKRRQYLKNKPYYARRCEMLLMYDFSFLAEILKRHNQIQPRYTNRELRDVMWHPMSLMEILRSRGNIIKNLGAYIVNRLPPSLALFVMKIAIKIMYRKNK